MSYAHPWKAREGTISVKSSAESADGALPLGIILRTPLARPFAEILI